VSRVVVRDLAPVNIHVRFVSHIPLFSIPFIELAQPFWPAVHRMEYLSSALEDQNLRLAPLESVHARGVEGLGTTHSGTISTL
jgi:hypothetical protein